MGKADTEKDRNAFDDEIKRLRAEIDHEFFSSAEPDVEKLDALHSRLEELCPSQKNMTEIEKDKKELLGYVKYHFNKEAEMLTEKYAKPVRHTRASSRLVRTVWVTITIMLLTCIITYASGINLFSFIPGFGDNSNKLKLTLNPDIATNPPEGSISDNPLFLPAEDQYFNDIESAAQKMPYKPSLPSYIPSDLEGYMFALKNATDALTRLEALYIDSFDVVKMSIFVKYYVIPHDLAEESIFYDDVYEVVETFINDGITAVLVQDANGHYAAYWVDGPLVYQVYTSLSAETLKDVVCSFR